MRFEATNFEKKHAQLLQRMVQMRWQKSLKSPITAVLLKRDLVALCFGILGASGMFTGLRVLLLALREYSLEGLKGIVCPKMFCSVCHFSIKGQQHIQQLDS